MILIVITGIIIYLVLIAWTWHSLGSIEKKKRIAFILIGIILLYGITWLIFPKTEFYAQLGEIQSKIQSTLVAIFAGVNGIIVMPQIGKLLDKIMEDEIKKENLVKRLLVLLLIFAMCAIFERGYMKDTQEGILKIYEKNILNLD